MILASNTITLVRVNDGATGATGKGIKSIAEKYAVSTSNSTAPSTWYDTVQTMTATNKYLWNYEIVTFTDNTTSNTSKRVIGVYGDKGNTGSTGATGKGISSITNYYLVTSASSGATTSTSGWSTTPSATTTTNKYLWNYEKITYTDNTTANTTPHIIGTHGATGAKGDTGATGAKGNTGEPGIDFSQGKMMHGDPMFASTTNSCNVYNNKSNGTVTVTRTAKSSDNPMTGTSYELTVTTSGEASPGLGGYVQSITSRANAVFVRRIIAKIPEGYSINNAENSMGSGYKVTWLTSKAGTGKFTEYIYKYVCGASGTFSSGGHVYINGTAATSSSPVTWYVAYSTTFDMTNVSDIKTARDEASEAAKTATNFMSFDSSSGLVVGDMTSSTLGKNVNIKSGSVDVRNGTTVLASFGTTATIGATSGSNVYIDSDSVDIRKGTTTLASFGASTVYIGKNATTSVINLCNSSATMRVVSDTDFKIYTDKRLVMSAYKSMLLDCYRDSTHSSRLAIQSSDPDDTSFISAIQLTCKQGTIENYLGLVKNNLTLQVTDGTNETKLNIDPEILKIYAASRVRINSKTSMQIGESDSYSAAITLGQKYNRGKSINCYWSDGSVHDLISNSSNGQGSYFGPANIAINDSSNMSSTTNIRGKYVRLYNHTGGGVYLGSSGSTAVTSDRNLKKDIVDVDSKYIDFFDRLRPITYKYNCPENNGHRDHIGFVAQEVEEALAASGLTTEQFAGLVIERDVTLNPDYDSSLSEEENAANETHYDTLYSLRYEEFISLLVKKVQNLQKQINQLTATA